MLTIDNSSYTIIPKLDDAKWIVWIKLQQRFPDSY